jgi:hypothetical protein
MELGESPEVKTAAKLAQQMAYENKARAAAPRHGPAQLLRPALRLLCGGRAPCTAPPSPGPRPAPRRAAQNALQAGLIVAGWDRREGGSVYAIPLGGTIEKVPFSIGGSGSAYIYALCDRLWKVSRPGPGPEGLSVYLGRCRTWRRASGRIPAARLRGERRASGGGIKLTAVGGPASSPSAGLPAWLAAWTA